MKNTIEIQAQEIKEKGSPLSIVQIIAFLEKKENNRIKKENKSAKNWKRREDSEEASNQNDIKLSKMTPRERADYFEDVQAQSIKNQLGSSMR